MLTKLSNLGNNSRMVLPKSFSGGGCWAFCLAAPGWLRSWGACPTASAGTRTAGAGGERAAGLQARPLPPPTRTPNPLAWRRDLRVPRAGPSDPTFPPAFRGNGGPASEIGWACPELRWASPTPVCVRWSEEAPVCALLAGGGLGWGAEFVLFFGPQGVSVGECPRETLLESGGVFSLWVLYLGSPLLL